MNSGANDNKVAAILQAVSDELEYQELPEQNETEDPELPVVNENIPDNEIKQKGMKASQKAKKTKEDAKKALNKVKQGRVTKQKEKQKQAVKPKVLRSKN